MSLTISAATITILKIVTPALAKTLLDHLGIGDTLTNKLLEQSVDVASDGISEGGKRQALEQQTQKLANRLQKEMQPLFEHEASNLEPGSREAIFLAVAETLLRGGISLDGLMNLALDAEQLTHKFLQAYPGATIGFSANEQSLYRQAIACASVSLIETVPQLEGFQLSVTQAMLRQLEELVCFVRLHKELALQQRDQFLTRYRQVIAAELDKPDKFGVPLLKNLLSQQRLCEAYVQLSFTEAAEEPEEAQLLHKQELYLDRRQKLEPRSQNVEKVLSTHRRLVIRGGGGAGKTSLMQWLAVHAARQDFEAPLHHWNSLVPFFVRLRNWVDQGFPAVKDFVLPIAKNIADEMPVGWVRQHLESGCALVLIDGVDELPRKERPAFFEALQKLVTEFPNAVYITTSRPAGLKDENGEEWVEWEQWVKIEQFSNCVMNPMTLPEIEQFVGRWHRALPASTRQDDKDPQKIGANLIRQLRQRPEIQQLAETPLLCTMICALHYDNEGTLPGTRLRLYDKCIEMLLEERDKQRDIKTNIHLTLEQKEGFLMEFAYWLMRNNYSDAEVEKADRQFQDYLKEYNLPDVTGRDIRNFLLERSGLLREPLMGQIDFVHRTFQEYLAAKAVLDHDDLGVLLAQADNDQWREAIIVAVGKGSRPQRKELLKGLLQRGDENDKKRHYLHLLAVACLETGVAIDADLRTDIETRAAALLPPKDEDEITLVARAGDAIVPLLEYDPSFSIDETCNCIEVLTRIGSPAAMEKLVDYAQAQTDAENDEYRLGWALGRGWHRFDVERYIHDVLVHRKTLDLSGTSVQEIGSLTALLQLQSLDLSETCIHDFSPLMVLPQLKKLYLSYTFIQDTCPLTVLLQLKVLSLSGTSVQDISPLTALSQLQSLYLSGTSIQDFSPLTALSQLQSLYLSRTSIQDFSPLMALSQLQSLYLSGTSIQDFSPLTALSQLKVLSLSGTSIQDISPLTALSQLQSLYLSGTSIQDFSPLTALSQLKVLDLSGTAIQDISSLTALSQLKVLSLSGTSIQDISPLTALSQLKVLSLSTTQVQTIDVPPKLKSILRIIG